MEHSHESSRSSHGESFTLLQHMRQETGATGRMEHCFSAGGRAEMKRQRGRNGDEGEMSCDHEGEDDGMSRGMKFGGVLRQPHCVYCPRMCARERAALFVRMTICCDVRDERMCVTTCCDLLSSRRVSLFTRSPGWGFSCSQRLPICQKGRSKFSHGGEHAKPFRNDEDA